jgi:hypothetical protein
MDIIKRNLPVAIIGLVTLLIFLGIIIAGQRNASIGPELQEIDEENLIAPHTPTLGDPEAPVTLVKFTDYQCPACAAFHPFVKALYEENRDLLRIAIRHFPLTQDGVSQRAAEATMAAAEQGGFFEYQDLVYNNNNNLSRDDLIRYAGMAGLDVEKFEQDLDERRVISMVSEDLSTARNLGISFTPAFFLNGKLMRYNTVEEFQAQVRAEIEKYRDWQNDVDGEQGGDVRGITDGSDEPEYDIDFDSVDEEYGVLEISYTDEGFEPRTSRTPIGRLVRFTNDTENEISLIQTVEIYQEFSPEVVLQPGESFELRLTVYKLFNFRETETQRLGSITVFIPGQR